MCSFCACVCIWFAPCMAMSFAPYGCKFSKEGGKIQQRDKSGSKIKENGEFIRSSSLMMDEKCTIEFFSKVWVKYKIILLHKTESLRSKSGYIQV